MGVNLEYKNGQTPIDEEEKEGLLIKSITTQKELDEFEQLNIEKAVEWIIETRLNSSKILSEKFIRNLHKKMFSEVWKWAGNFRKTDKNIGVKWTQIGLELKILIDDTHYWIANKTYPPEEIAIRFKHRIVSIHCFRNGNGRHSRMMADLIMEYVFDKKPFNWQQANRLNADETRKKYIVSLKQADDGNVHHLIEFARN